jgi:surface antigen
MQLISQKNLSSYLVRADLSPRRNRQWGGFNSRLMLVKRSNTHLAPRMITLLAIWCMGFMSISAFINHSKLNTHSVVSDNSAVTSTRVISSEPALVHVADVQTLPSDPTGQMLPSIPMAPDYTYSNDYDWGQCTWYVAGRRQVPSNWGNADTWYERAQESGWAVGTTPAIGAIASTTAGYYGHVALVEKISADYEYVYVSEMNYVGVGTKSYRWARASSFSYIY